MIQKEMNELEKMIRENRESMDGFEPPRGHFSRFRMKLTDKQGTVLRFGDFMKIAAVIVLASLFSFFVYSRLENAFFARQRYTLGEISPEYKEVEEYYTGQIKARYNEIENLEKGDPGQRKMIIHELSEMDSLMKQLQRDLKTNPGDERIINAMISHYQMKLGVMNQILDQLENINNNHQSSNHESKDI